MPACKYCSIEDVKMLVDTSSCDTSESSMAPLLQVASAWVENFTQRVLCRNTYEDEADRLRVDRWGRIVGRTRQWPIYDVTALSVYLDGLKTPIDLTPQIEFVRWKRPPQRVFWYSGPLTLPAENPMFGGTGGEGFGRISRGSPGEIQFTYTAGYDPIPRDIVLAAAYYVIYLLSIPANPLGASSISASATMASSSVSFPQEGSFYITMAQQLLDQYVRKDGGEAD